MPLASPLVYEQGDHLYMVASVSPQQATEQEIEEFAFAADLKKMAPNEHIAWFGGHYVEADAPNLNGAMWTAGDLSIAQFTPMFMPVTVMHDPRTAVGLIADAKLMTPEANGVPRAKIETALALWKHRFPDAVEEAVHNYREGTLMQSMECLAPDYECGACGLRFHKLPGGAERANWCAHLKGEEGATPTRILRSVVFTGTGLIFGTRGAQGADPSAHLESFQQEVAEFHQRVHRDSAPPRRKRRMENIEVPKAEYDELRARPSRDELASANERAEKAEKELEKLEGEKSQLTTERDELKTKVEQADETARRVTLRDERMGKLGAGFTAKLGDKTKLRLTEQAGQMSDDDWTARLEEVEEAYGVKRDEGGESTESESEFSKEEVARARAGNGGGGASLPSDSKRRSVVAGLVKPRK
jgi:hypothetical protein